MSRTPDLKGSSFTLSVLHLSDNNVEQAIHFLQEKVDQAPAFFASAPVVINIDKVTNDVDFKKLKKGIQQTGMIPVGISGSKDKRLQSLASEAGFAIMSASKPVAASKSVSTDKPASASKPAATNKVEPSQQAAPSAPPAPSNFVPTKVIRTPVRSGQQIYAKDGDLVILNHVSEGAEVIADGSIHIYGALRGRAIAGASGNKDAVIACSQLHAELMSIAGHYWLTEQFAPELWQKNVVLSLHDDSLKLELLTI
ncbi:septum site-determining protein MinC [Vibrio xiamenensis]|uniref:Probable septum site-determining protein MinC n=1 Tax=Vibrio xiamenensis TaxID=861298 RepID=A0A1G7ZDK8_9VIBR|nr:septum site-determining protein MinC [Vibrio xiamenensis]SDH06832.1 septum site-determining protein MinC [Vibrio xiamenensis]